MSLRVQNPSEHAWAFGAALHTYLSVSNLALIDLGGLQNARFLDQTKSGLAATQEQCLLHVDTEIDRIYLDVSEPIVITDGQRVITVAKQGFGDAVVWNPGPEKGSRLVDMAAGDYRSFVCVEAGAVGSPVVLAGGERWLGSQSLTIGYK